jgi:hypothetical protein
MLSVAERIQSLPLPVPYLCISDAGVLLTRLSLQQEASCSAKQIQNQER